MLLDRLFEEGMTGNTWRSWYEGAFCKVKSDGGLSEGFIVERGVKQASLLSPSCSFEAAGGIWACVYQSITSMPVHGFLHADNIRTLATSVESPNAQVSLVKNFAENNFLKLNVQKHELVVFSSDGGTGIPYYV